MSYVCDTRTSACKLIKPLSQEKKRSDITIAFMNNDDATAFNIINQRLQKIERDNLKWIAMNTASYQAKRKYQSETEKLFIDDKRAKQVSAKKGTVDDAETINTRRIASQILLDAEFMIQARDLIQARIHAVNFLYRGIPLASIPDTMPKYHDTLASKLTDKDIAFFHAIIPVVKSSRRILDAD